MDRTLLGYRGRNCSLEIDGSDQLMSVLVDGYRGVAVADEFPPHWERYGSNSLEGGCGEARNVTEESGPKAERDQPYAESSALVRATLNGKKTCRRENNAYVST